jgi:hypothetical protein
VLRAGRLVKGAVRGILIVAAHPSFESLYELRLLCTVAGGLYSGFEVSKGSTMRCLTEIYEPKTKYDDEKIRKLVRVPLDALNSI